MAVFILCRNPLKEAGEASVHKVTAGVAKIRENNLHRDFFRFIRLPIDLVYVTCPVLTEPWMNDRVQEVQLPMIDPHELLEYLNKSGQLNVHPGVIATLVQRFFKFWQPFFLKLRTCFAPH